MYFNFLNVTLLSKRCHLIINVSYDLKKECFEVISEKNDKSFSKGLFHSHFLHFSVLLQIIHTMSNINKFALFLI